MKAILEITDEQLLDVVAFVKERKITAVFEGAFLLEVGKKYKSRKGEVVLIDGEKHGDFTSGSCLYMANGRIFAEIECEFDLIEEVKEDLPFEMVVGGVYEDREGREEEIVRKHHVSMFPFEGKSGRRYTDRGGCHVFSESDFDLIKRIR